MLTAFLMSGCQNNRSNPPLIENDARLPHQIAGASDSLILALEKRLKKKNIRIISMGDDYLISVPTGLIFADQSPRITWDSFAVLNEVACYLRLYRKIGVQVSTYVSQYGTTRREYALSLARSNAVANYLWSQGIESRFIFAHGQGSEKPIVSKVSQDDRAPNARIEITFRRVEA